MRIGLLSDTHGYLDPRLFTLFARCDEIWHAGDIGNVALYDELNEFKPCRAVFGNIDDKDVRITVPEWQSFECGGMHILMTHIGGYPGRYSRGIKEVLMDQKPHVFICGHSHILKVIYDKQLNLLHINPGAAGNHGIHKIRTALRFSINNGRIEDTEILELGTRGKAKYTFQNPG